MTKFPQLLQLVNNEGFQESKRLDYIFENFPIQSGEVNALLARGIKEGNFKAIDFPTLFLMILHGGGTLLCMRPLGKHLGLKADRNDNDILQQAKAVVSLVLDGLVIKN